MDDHYKFTYRVAIVPKFLVDRLMLALVGKINVSGATNKCDLQTNALRMARFFKAGDFSNNLEKSFDVTLKPSSRAI